MIHVLTYFGDSSSGIGALGVDYKAFIIQLITFILGYFVLRKWAFGPIAKVLRERRELIEKGVKLGEEMQKERAALDEQVTKALADARARADAVLAEANDAARATVRDAETKAREKAEGILKEAEGRIATDTARARQKLEGELVGLISEATEAIIDEKVDSRKDAQLIDRALKGRAGA